MQRLLKLGFGVILCIEVLLVFFSFLVESTSQAMELVAFSISLAIFTIVGISMFFPRVRVEEIEVAPPVPSQSSPPAGSGSLPVKPAPGQVVIAPPPAVQRPTPVKAAGVFSKIRRKPEIVKLVSSTEDTTVSTLTPVPTIVPMGMIKPPEAGPKEKFPSIVPRKVEQAVLVTPVPKRQTFAPQEEIDYETLMTKAKGMKFSLIGWWPLGWSRVITYPDMPAQFWKLEKDKPKRGIIVGFDESTGEYVAWGATAIDGIFKGIHEVARDESQEKLMAKVKEMMQKIDLFEAEEAEEKSSPTGE